MKVVDFGLAKAVDPGSSAASGPQSPTIPTPAMTQAGAILGTAGGTVRVLMAAPFRIATETNTPDIGEPVALFAPPFGNAIQLGDARHRYMVSSDGQRVLVER